MMRNFYIHIGCGKTGSSALQVWLWNNNENLEAAGFKYPVFGRAKVDDYEITSGNGVFLISELEKGRIREFFGKFLQESKGDIIFSSEAFQSVDNIKLKELGDVVAEFGFKPIIVAYVRDVYDISYSSYVQQVKRHRLSESFKSFCLARNTLQQFSVVRRYCSLFDDVRLIHYETAMVSGIDLAFQKAVGFSIDERISKKKVNRSLSVLEVEIMRIFNEVSSGLQLPERVGARVSDALIASSPEKSTGVYYDDSVYRHLEEITKEDLVFVNNRLPEGEVRVFTPEGKNIVRSLPDIELDVIDTVKSVFQVMGRLLNQEHSLPEQESSNGLPGILQFLLKEATKREASTPEEALQLLRAARVFRKNGPVVNERIRKCEEKVRDVK
ncbi:MAG: hypothetical protein ACQEV6_08170 [Pseudomonadota bacterium]